MFRLLFAVAEDGNNLFIYDSYHHLHSREFNGFLIYQLKLQHEGGDAAFLAEET